MHLYTPACSYCRRGSLVRVRFKQGLAGEAAASGGFQNTPHITGNEQLTDFERRSIHGHAAKNMLCACIYTEDGDLVGLLQAINKKHGVFTSADEKLLQTLCAQSGVMMHHADMLRTMRKQSQARFDLCQYSVKVLSCPDLSAICKLIASHGAKVQQHTLQHTLQYIATRTTTCSITLQHSATHYNTLQHTTRCNTHRLPRCQGPFCLLGLANFPTIQIYVYVSIYIYTYVYICIYMYTYPSEQIYTASL